MVKEEEEEKSRDERRVRMREEIGERRDPYLARGRRGRESRLLVANHSHTRHVKIPYTIH